MLSTACCRAKVLGREFSLPDLNTLARLPASLQISVPEAPPQVAAALRANPRAALLASALGALLAAFALFRALAALARAAFGQRGGGEAARLQAEAAALDRQRTATAAQQECDTEAALTLQAAAGLERELASARELMARREAQLSAVTSEARRQSRDANAALAASQHQVERLEGLAVALRESLGGGNGAAGAAAAVAGLGGAERGELARRFKELRQQLESAQWHVQVAEARARDLEHQLAALADNGEQLATAMRKIQDGAARQAQQARAAAAAAQRRVAAAAADASLGGDELAALAGEAKQQLSAARERTRASALQAADMAAGLRAALAAMEEQDAQQKAAKRRAEAAREVAAHRSQIQPPVQEQRPPTPPMPPPVRQPRSQEPEQAPAQLAAAAKAAQPKRWPSEPFLRPARASPPAVQPSAVQRAGNSSQLVQAERKKEQQQRPASKEHQQQQPEPAAQARVQHQLQPEPPSLEAQPEQEAPRPAQAATQPALQEEQPAATPDTHAQAAVAAAAENAAARAAAPVAAAALGLAASSVTAPDARADEGPGEAPPAASADQDHQQQQQDQQQQQQPAATGLLGQVPSMDAVRAQMDEMKRQMAAQRDAMAQLLQDRARAMMQQQAPQEQQQQQPGPGEGGGQDQPPPLQQQRADGNGASPRPTLTRPGGGEAAVAFVGTAPRPYAPSSSGSEAAAGGSDEEAPSDDDGRAGGGSPSDGGEAAPSTSSSDERPPAWSMFGAAPAGKAAGAAGQQPWLSAAADAVAAVQAAFEPLAQGALSATLPLPALRPASPGVQERTLTLAAAGIMIPSARKAAAGERGEDAWFVSRAGCGALGVADGVGGWAAEGVDPAAYALKLMERCGAALEGPYPCRSALAALEYAQASTKLPGSSTACVAQLRGGGRLEVVNLGDSGLRLVRDGRVAWSTEVQEHVWNCPYQLSHPRVVPNTDTAADAAVDELEVSPGDVLVLGTDGLWDNMWEAQLLEVLGSRQGGTTRTRDGRPLEAGKGGTGERAAAALARRLAEAAARNAADSWYRGPWATELEQHNKVSGLQRLLGARGGKVDDITVVVAIVC